MATNDLVVWTEVKSYLQLDVEPIPDDWAMLVTNFSARIEAYTGRWFITRQAVDILDSGGGAMLFPRHYPIQGTPTVTDMVTNLPVAGFITYNGGGYLYRDGGWDTGRQRYKVEYTAGMCQDTAMVPADVKQACLEWIKTRYERRDPALKRETLGDYSYTTEDEKNGIPASVKAALSLYVIPRGC